MGVEESQEEGIAYTITAGFYPELASAIKWGTPKKGTAGGTGRTYARKTGFSPSSINRMIVDEDPSLKAAFRNISGTQPKVGLKNKEGTWYGHEGFKMITGGMRAALEKSLLKGETPSMLPQKMTGDAGMRTRLSMSKWLGGSETYKLWGTRVWYQAGIRDKEMLLDAVKRWNGTSDYISQLYSNIEDNTLVPIAKELAEKVFEEALDKDSYEEDFEELVSNPEVAEETMEAYPPSWKMEVSDKVIDGLSKANKIDMSRTLEDGTREYIDVTEMPITAMEQHGISSVPKALQESIDGLKGQNDKLGLRTIKKEVINLFINNIDRDNKLIDILVKKAEKTTGGKKVKTFEALLKEAAKELRTEEGDMKKISRKEISSWAQIKEVSKGVGMGALKSAHDTAKLKTKLSANVYSSQAAMVQVIHMLASMGDAKASSFRQGMRVTEPDKHGRSVYASVPLVVGKRMRFLKGPVRKKTIVRAGYSHTLALAEKERGLSKVKASAIHRKMHQSFSRAKIRGTGDNGRLNSYRAATLGVQMKGSHHSTTVTYSPKGMAAILENAGKAAAWDISKINKNAKTLLRDAMVSWGGRANNSFNEAGRATGKMIRQRGNPREGARFWALPYVGVLDNQYHEAAKKKNKK